MIHDYSDLIGKHTDISWLKSKQAGDDLWVGTEETDFRSDGKPEHLGCIPPVDTDFKQVVASDIRKRLAGGNIGKSSDKGQLNAVGKANTRGCRRESEG